MDLFDLLVLLFLVFPIIGRVLGNLRKQRPQSAPDQTEEKESFFDRAIREIEAALDEASGDSRESAQGKESRQPARKPSRGAEPSLEQVPVRMDEFHDEAVNRFESLKYTEFHELKDVGIDKTLFGEPDSAVRGRHGSRSGRRIRRKLRNNKSARDAFVLSEILGPRPGTRRGTR
ncbi:MAG: hypothetical protein HKN43_07300 [Rhodothermales bacterium]|nr:hypothetical protein [Rhodothermales bacterium]